VVPAAVPLAERLRRRIADEGPLAFSAFMDAALYDPDDGFFASGGRAGGRGDFLTSVEVGPLFGAVLARALDRWWEELGRPDPFVVADVGAGLGTLARTVTRAEPRCTPALVYVMVERSERQRRRHAEHLRGFAGELGVDVPVDLVVRPRAGAGPVTVSSGALPPPGFTGVVLANELLDNVAFDVVRAGTDGGVEELRVGSGDHGDFVATVVARPVADAAATLEGVAAGVWVPHQAAAAAWVGEVRRHLDAGFVVVLDYLVTDQRLALVDDLGWLRTFRGHERGSHPLAEPGSQDITADVAVDQLLRRQPGASVVTQRDFLLAHGIDELVEEGRRTWAERAHLGDLEAVRGRSRIREAEALLDPAGLGAFGVLRWTVDP
jgi:SAM-dependent MidA family methyltransferase